MWSVAIVYITWQRFQDVYMASFTSAQDFRLVTLATQPVVIELIEAIRSISNSCQMAIM